MPARVPENAKPGVNSCRAAVLALLTVVSAAANEGATTPSTIAGFAVV